MATKCGTKCWESAKRTLRRILSPFTSSFTPRRTASSIVAVSGARAYGPMKKHPQIPEAPPFVLLANLFNSSTLPDRSSQLFHPQGMPVLETLNDLRMLFGQIATLGRVFPQVKQTEALQIVFAIDDP